MHCQHLVSTFDLSLVRSAPPLGRSRRPAEALVHLLAMDTNIPRGRVHHKQRGAQPADPIRLGLIGDVLEELPADPEGASGQADLGLAGLLELLAALIEQVQQVQQVLSASGRPDGAHIGDVFGGREDGGAAEGVADQDRGGRVGVAQVISRVDQVGDVGREVGVGEVAAGRDR